MTDFDNGLPPVGSDIRDKEINAILIDKQDFEIISFIQEINAVLVDKSNLLITATSLEVNAILIDRKKDGTNSGTFL